MKNENTQHTPAPWKTNGTQIFKFDESKGEQFQDREIIANIYTAHQDNKEQREATAQLIARAPELLKENEQLKVELKDLRENKRLNTIGLSGYAPDELHTLNAELLEALKNVIADISAPYGFDATRIPNESVKKALLVIEKTSK